MSIMLRIADSDEQAIRSVMQDNLDKILAIAYRIVFSQEDSEEIAQEVFFKLFNQAKKWEKKASLTTWLYRVAINTSINFKKKKKNNWPLDKVSELDLAQSSNQSFYSEVVDQEKLTNALKKLNKNQRIALTLFYFDNLKLKEAAEVMEISEDAFESLLRRSRLKLKTLLEKKETIEKISWGLKQTSQFLMEKDKSL